MARRGIEQAALVCGLALLTGEGWAQEAPAARPAPVAEGSVGWAGFGDEGIIHHATFGGTARVYLTRRLSIGPELIYAVGPDSDRDLFLTGNLTVDLLAPTAAKPRRTTPYVVIGGGLFRHSDQFVGETFSSNEGAFTAGVGVRAWMTDRVYVAIDARAGWEPHVRVAATVGVAIGK